MKLIHVENQVEGGKKAFELIREGMEERDVKVLGLATGSTPITMYEAMVNSDVDFSDMIGVNLDEYVGLDGEDEQSYRYFMNEHLYNAKPFKETYVPNGVAEDADAECARYNQILADNPIDIQVLGIGTNGHIGFNEPGTPFDSETRKVDLVESTIESNKRFFASAEDVPTQAYSMGIGSILKAKEIILIAYGEAKADAIKGMIEGEITEDCPASALQKHDNVTVILDDAAAEKLSEIE
ncbi:MULTISPECIES: glucosamine-6-phosphate deaminase [Vagococcus]|uniref:Glucosamine-6-phosphate deaminase n=1 Tax=Vagococcus lutrae TaxID=81947 RepID=A0AAE9XL70_9ENTE|nr:MULTISPECIES: glucosamine-6-phosphate deaminase [Vagococcus]MCO7151309.1 glucosamine-6-phosphate deaminase [Vagococcus lutrae]MDO5741433.1 glucosamine-6-phosphate deaminase [Vagococcus sp.]MDT2801156.1 glucosamine-6-phosphate deaminase [Vagococcus lutrae]MDT2808120.1 glucosamine-6-phosphate deaminase [Vagococcus lutrae]MDT2812571.1 glucosamine-6-phosphate deaminase [Vagococcus lutrae]